MNDFRVIPYLPLDGILPLRDSHVLAFWAAMVRDGTVRRVFFDGSVTTAGQFLEKAKRADNLFFFCFDGDRPAAVCWLDSMSGTRAHIHFCVFKETWGQAAKALGKMVLKTIGGMRTSTGAPLLGMVLGVTEASNALAVRFAKSIGLSKCGYVPGYLFDAWDNVNADAVFLAYSFGG